MLTSMVDQAEGLRQIIRDSNKRDPSATLNRLILVFGGNAKIGVTSVVVNLALALARRSSKVAMVDLNHFNPQLADFCRIKIPSHNSATLCETRLGRELLYTGPCGVELLPLNYSRNQFENPETEFRCYVEDSFFALKQSHTIIVDAGSEMNCINKRLCELASDIVVLTTETPQSIVESYGMIKAIGSQTTAATIHTVVNRSASYAQAREVHHRIEQSCDRFLNLHVQKLGTLPHDLQFTQSLNVGRPLLLQTPHSLTALQFNDMAESLHSKMCLLQRRNSA